MCRKKFNNYESDSGYGPSCRYKLQNLPRAHAQGVVLLLVLMRTTGPLVLFVGKGRQQHMHTQGAGYVLLEL